MYVVYFSYHPQIDYEHDPFAQQIKYILIGMVIILSIFHGVLFFGFRSLIKKKPYHNYTADEICLACTLINSKKVAFDVYNSNTSHPIRSLSEVY